MHIEERLRAVAPTLFRKRVTGGAYVGEGWVPLLVELCLKLEAIVVALPEEQRPVVEQVKQKFGGLRFYLSQTNAEIDDLIDAAESVSVRTCESCGKPGHIRGGGWWTTLCDDHAAGREVVR